jgi:hypothetical protein
LRSTSSLSGQLAFDNPSYAASARSSRARTPTVWASEPQSASRSRPRAGTQVGTGVWFVACPLQSRAFARKLGGVNQTGSIPLLCQSHARPERVGAVGPPRAAARPVTSSIKATRRSEHPVDPGAVDRRRRGGTRIDNPFVGIRTPLGITIAVGAIAAYGIIERLNGGGGSPRSRAPSRRS